MIENAEEYRLTLEALADVEVQLQPLRNSRECLVVTRWQAARAHPLTNPFDWMPASMVGQLVPVCHNG
ncbi:MAG: hypothetical protein EBT22_03825 [Chloroflexi bacterium]|nr:hypothetical protein [Chloroflexota bacterium]